MFRFHLVNTPNDNIMMMMMMMMMMNLKNFTCPYGYS